MRVQSQLERYNEKETEKTIRESRERQLSTKHMDSIEEAAYMAGEMIAGLNNGKNIKAEDVIKATGPKYLKK